MLSVDFAECRLCSVAFMLSVIMLNVVMLSAIMLSVVAPSTYSLFLFFSYGLIILPGDNVISSFLLNLRMGQIS
jgi:hypothetical protein